MQEQHGKVQIFDQQTLRLLYFRGVCNHEQGTYCQSKIAAGCILRCPELSCVQVREMKVQRHSHDAVNKQNHKLIDELSAQNQPNMLLIFYLLLAVELAKDPYLIHQRGIYLYYQFKYLINQAKIICYCLCAMANKQRKLIIFIQQQLMHRNRCKSVWRRKKSQYTKIDRLDEDVSFEQLRSVSKRLAIMSRLEKKQQKSSQYKKINNTHSNVNLSLQKQQYKTVKSVKRPATTGYNRKLLNNIENVKQVFKKQKRMNDQAMVQKYQKTVKTSLTNATTSVKQGLLGQYQRYNQMSKHQLIQKLISLQYLANNIFKKNKLLQEKIRSIDPNYKTN